MFIIMSSKAKWLRRNVVAAQAKKGNKNAEQNKMRMPTYEHIIPDTHEIGQ